MSTQVLQKISHYLSLTFNYSLVGYLIAYLLENILPGFVSNNFDINYLLYIVLFTGILNSLSSRPDTNIVKSPSTIFDWLIAIGLSLLGGGLIYLKLDLEPNLKIAISLLSTLLIALLSAILLWPEHPLKLNFHLPKLHLSKKILGLIALVIIIIVGTYLNQNHFLSSTKIEPDSSLTLKVLNGTLNSEEAPSLARFLINQGYPQTYYGQANNLQYSNATIIFDEADTDQANLIKKLISPYYPVITLEPPLDPSPGTITIILGYPTTP